MNSQRHGRQRSTSVTFSIPEISGAVRDKVLSLALYYMGVSHLDILAPDSWCAHGE